LELNGTKFYVVTDESAQKTIGIKSVITITHYLSNCDNYSSMWHLQIVALLYL